MTASVPSGHRPVETAEPPDAVSPDTPAFVIVTPMPLAFSAAANRGGKAASAGNPNPALSESPEHHDFDRPLSRLAGARQQRANQCDQEPARKTLDPGGVPPI